VTFSPFSPPAIAAIFFATECLLFAAECFSSRSPVRYFRTGLVHPQPKYQIIMAKKSPKTAAPKKAAKKAAPKKTAKKK
jgi:hypothetical protein